MTIEQLYLAIGVPIIVNVVFNGLLFGILFQVLNHRLNKIEDDLRILTSKVVDIDNRVIRIEDKLNMPPAR